jgi:putative salt-induced outer membrane protein
LAIALITGIVTIHGPNVSAATTTQFTFSESAEKIISRSDEEDDLPTLYRILFAEIAKDPEQGPAIVRRMVALAPQHRDRIVETASAAFPDLAVLFGAAQVDPDEDPAEPEKPELTGELDVSASMRTGNDPNDSLDIGLTLAYEPGSWEHAASVKFALAQDSQRVTTDRFFSSYTPRYNFTDRFFVGGHGEFIRDKDDGFKWTAVESIGPGYRIFNNDHVELTVSAGPGLRQAQEKKRDGSRLQNHIIGRGTLDLLWHITDVALFSNSANIFGDDERLQSRNTTAFTYNFLDNIAGRLSYEVRHNSNPPDDTKELDTESKASIVFGF